MILTLQNGKTLMVAAKSVVAAYDVEDSGGFTRLEVARVGMTHSFAVKETAEEVESRRWSELVRIK